MIGEAVSWPEIAAIASAAGVAVAGLSIRAADRRRYDDLISAMHRDLADFKLHVANNHPLAAELNVLRSDLMQALNRLTERIDRLLERDDP